MHVNDVPLEDIRYFLEGEKDNLTALLETLRTYFEIYANSQNGKGRIYRVYSRGEKQNGDEFKAIWKILPKLLPGMVPAQVPDIIGLTVVCPFTSDQAVVERYIQQQSERGDLIIHSTYRHDPVNKLREIPGRTAYEATHYELTTPRYVDLRCEVQVKTVLHDAWAAKTHDLSYKPSGVHDRRLNIQMDTLSTILTALEKETEVIRELAEESWHFDKEKKRVARLQIARGLIQNLNAVEDESHKTSLQELQKFVSDRRDDIAACHQNDTLIGTLREYVKVIGDKYRYDRNLCQIVAEITILRPNNDLLSWMLNCVSLWKATHDYTTIPSPYHFASLILYSCGDIERAIREEDRGIYERRKNMPEGCPLHAHALAAALSALSYYYAEVAGTPLGERLNAEHLAKKYVIEARELFPEHLGIIDTEGYVLITYGKSESDVEDGLQKCEKAWQALKGDTTYAEVSELFYKIHRRAAYRRMLQF